MTGNTGTSGARQFRKKPVVIEAMQFTGDNGATIALWSGESVRPVI